LAPLRRARLVAVAVVGFLVLGAVGFALLRWARTASPGASTWVKVTNFPDSATSPALSLDGRMITFIRGPDTFVSSGQICVKLLPDGQPAQLTHDNHQKMAPVFSPYMCLSAKMVWLTVLGCLQTANGCSFLKWTMQVGGHAAWFHLMEAL